MERDLTKTHTGLPAPDDWHIVEWREDGLMWERLEGQRIAVIESTKVEADGRTWLHVSVSKPNGKIPTYEDLRVMRDLFVGDRECYMVFPTKERYVNFANVLHLWACLDSPQGVLPHFEGVVNGVVTV